MSDLSQSLIHLSPNRASLLIIFDGKILRVMWSQKFSHTEYWRLLLEWHCAEFFMVDVRSSNSYCLDPEQHFLFQGLDVCFYVESEVMWEDEWDITSPSQVTSPNTIGVWFSSTWIWICSEIDTQTLWNLRFGVSGFYTTQFSISFSNSYCSEIATWCCFPDIQCPTDLSWQHSKRNLKQKFTRKKLII